MKTKDRALQFRVKLMGTEPEVWRRIVVPEDYSFWDLHVAIQDAMGWLDYHLHAFQIQNPDTGEMDQLGIPDDSFEDMAPFLAGWEIPIGNYFRDLGHRADYEYDFGDGWQHAVVLEGIPSRIPRRQYPICVDGARACPPEDCGGVSGYERMLAALGDPTDEEHERMVEWTGGEYDPAAFSPKTVRFDDPKTRWRNAFQGRGRHM